jgi:hypothetical protein
VTVLNWNIMQSADKLSIRDGELYTATHLHQSALHVASLCRLHRCVNQPFSSAHRMEEKFGRCESWIKTVFHKTFCCRYFGCEQTTQTLNTPVYKINLIYLTMMWNNIQCSLQNLRPRCRLLLEISKNINRTNIWFGEFAFLTAVMLKIQI